MYKQPVCYGGALLMALTLIMSTTGCKRDTDNAVPSPGLVIMQSEQLVLPDAVSLPADLPGGNSRVVTFYAEGVQKYKAQAKPGSNQVTYEWVFVAPQADLYGENNIKVGTHSAGPTWQLLSPGLDTIYGQAFSPAKTAPSPDGTSIDWLLLMPMPGKKATGLFANVAYIQRIATSGGKAPATPPTGPDQTIEVPYKAVYRFSKHNQ
jgi:hypothetical protein